MIPEWRHAFDRDSAAFADVLATTDPSVPVATCPGWTLTDLAGHLGGVHRWALASLDTPADGPPPAEEDPPSDELHAWFVEGATALRTTLHATEPDQPCWGFGPMPRTATFWIRRQAHETAMHLWDAEAAAGRATCYDPALAPDGIEELLGTFLPRQLRLGRIEPFPEVLRIVAGTTTYDVGHGSPDVTLTGPAEAVLLALWRRTTPDDPRLGVVGDRAALDRVLARAIGP